MRKLKILVHSIIFAMLIGMLFPLNLEHPKALGAVVAPAWDFEDHTYDHISLTNLSTDQITNELITMNSVFQAHGLPPPLHLSYPNGLYNSTVINIISPYRLSGRTTNSPKPDTYPVSWYNLNAINIDSNTTFDKAKGWIDTAVLEKGILNLFSHDVQSQPSAYGTTPVMLQQILDYLVSQQNSGNLKVTTIREVYTNYNGKQAMVVLSFDDGSVTDYTNVWPMFTSRGLAGTSYIVGSRIDHADPTALTWGMVDEMAQVQPPNWPLLISTNPVVGGITTTPPGMYNVGPSPLTVTANPADGYIFGGWLFDGSQSMVNPITLTAQSNDKNHSLIANFIPANMVSTSVFQDGFDGGDFSAWSNVSGSITTVSSPIFSGPYSAQATGPNACWIKNLGSGYSDLFFAGYVQVPTNLAKGQQALFLYILNGTSGSIVAGGLQTDNNGTNEWILRVNNNWFYSQSFSLQMNRWYLLQIEYNIDGIAALLVDGTLVCSAVGQTLLGNAQVVQGGNPYGAITSGYISYGDNYQVSYPTATPTKTPAPASSPTPTPLATASNNPPQSSNSQSSTSTRPYSTNQPSNSPTSSPQIPEFSVVIFLFVLIGAALIAIISKKSSKASSCLIEAKFVIVWR